jgi:hypothetical protein
MPLAVLHFLGTGTSRASRQHAVAPALPSGSILKAAAEAQILYRQTVYQ